MTAPVLIDVGSRSMIQGGQKKIFHGVIKIDGEDIQCAIAKPRANSTLDKEVDLWRKVCEPGHPNILRFHHYFLEPRPMIAMELVDPIGFDLVALGSLYNYDERLVPVHELAVIFRQLASALLYLHDEKQIVHRDLKADQVLVTIDQQAKLTDFGLSESIPEIARDIRVRWMFPASNIAPEIKRRNDTSAQPYGGEVDAFGLGHTLKQLAGARGDKLNESYVRKYSDGDAQNAELLADFLDSMHRLSSANKANRMSIAEFSRCRWIQHFSEERGHVALTRTPSGGIPAPRDGLSRFAHRFKATSALLPPTFPEEGMHLRDMYSGEDWTCLLIEAPAKSGNIIHETSGETVLHRGDRVFFGCKDQSSVRVTAKTEEDVQQLRDALGAESSTTIQQRVTVCDVELFQGFEVDPASELGVGNEIIFNYDPKVKLSQVIGFRLGDETERNESIEGLLPFQLDFDFFKFPHEKVSPSAVLGLEQHKTSPEQQALNLRQRTGINLAGRVKLVPVEQDSSGVEIEWVPGPRCEVHPGDLGLVVRFPTRSRGGISLPTLSCDKFKKMLALM